MPQVLSAVKALILHQGKYIVLKQTLHKGEIWDLPGGKIEYGESPEEALRREVKEELCLNINILKSIGVWYFFSQNHKHQIICHTFLCKPQGEVTIDTTKNPAVSEHIDEYRWLTLDQILSNPDITIADSLRSLLTSLPN